MSKVMVVAFFSFDGGTTGVSLMPREGACNKQE